MDIELALKECGLNDKEAKIYISLLQVGISPVSRIAEKSQIQRTTTYHVLKSLKEKGLVSFIVKDKKTYFEATHPTKLINSLKEKEKKINQILPNLIEIKESAINKPKVTLYEGKSGLISILEDILNTKSDFLCYASKDALLKILTYYFPNFIERRVNLGMRARLILNKKPIAQKLTKYKIIKQNFNTATWIYLNKVAILSLAEREPIGMIIEDKDIANTQKQVFEMMWKKIKKK